MQAFFGRSKRKDENDNSKNGPSSQAIPSSPHINSPAQATTTLTAPASEPMTTTAAGPAAVMVGKSSRAPLVRLREGMLLEFDAIKGKKIHDPPSRFPSLGTKKEGLVYLRFSFGKGLPEARSPSTARVNHACEWSAEDPAQIVVTNELAKLSGPELRLLVEAYSETAEGKRAQDSFLGSGTIDLSEHLNKEPVILQLVLDPKKPSKGAEVEIKLSYVALPTASPDKALTATQEALEANGPLDALISGSSGAGGEPSPGGSTLRKSVTFEDPKALVTALASSGPVSPSPATASLSTATTTTAAAAVAAPPAKPTRPDSTSPRDPTISSSSPRDNDSPGMDQSMSSIPQQQHHHEQHQEQHQVLVSTIAVGNQSQMPASQSEIHTSSSTSASSTTPAAATNDTISPAVAAAGPQPNAATLVKALANDHSAAPPARSVHAEEATHGLAERLIDKIKGEMGAAAAILHEATHTAAATSSKASDASPSMVRQLVNKVKQDVSKHLGIGGGGGAGVEQNDNKPPTTTSTTDRGTSPPAAAAAASSTSKGTPPLNRVQDSKEEMMQHHQQQASLDTTLEGHDSVLMRTTTLTSLAGIEKGGHQEGKHDDEGKGEGGAKVDGKEAKASADSEARSPFGEMTLTDVVKGMEPEDENDEFVVSQRAKHHRSAPPRGPSSTTEHMAIIDKRTPSKPALSKEEAVERLQSAWRGKQARREIWIQNLQARRIQSLFRGHKDRKKFEERRGFLLRLEAYQLRREEWQRRIMRNQRELALLKATPALELNQMDQRRRDFAARRIQFFCRKKMVVKNRSRSREANNKDLHASTLHHSLIPPLLDAGEEEVIQDFISTYHQHRSSPLSPSTSHAQQSSPSSPSKRLHLSALRLSDLQKRVIATSKTKSPRSTIKQLESALSNGIRDIYASRQSQSGAQARYQKLLEARYQARVLAAEHSQRAEVKEERHARLGRVRGLLDQLENPPTLVAFRKAFSLEPDAKGRLPSHKQVRAVPEISLSWRLPSQGKSVKVAEEAHKHALEIMQEDKGRWWVTSLPEDLSETPVDIRQIKTPFPYEGQAGHVGGPCLMAGEGHLLGAKNMVNEEEASLWWYTYARKGSTPSSAAASKTSGQAGYGDLLYHRARVGRTSLHEKYLEDEEIQEVTCECATSELVSLILRERKRRMTVENLAATAKERLLAAEGEKDQAAARIQAAYRGRLARKENIQQQKRHEQQQSWRAKDKNPSPPLMTMQRRTVKA